MRFVSRDEWELMKRHTSEHLHDQGWPRHPRRTAAPESPRTPTRPQTTQYFSGNYPGKTAD
jgi:hypothetical protein